MNLNKVFLIGRLTKDPEGRTTPAGRPVTSFSIATNRVWNDASGKKQEATEYHNIVVWGGLAEIAAQYLIKGQEIFIEGRLQTRSWDGQDGIKRYTTEIIAENFQMGAKAQGSGMKSGGYGSANSNYSEQALSHSESGFSQPAAAEMDSYSPVQEFQESQEIKIENIPF